MHQQSKSRIIVRMTLDELVDRITRLRKKRGLSERRLCLDAGMAVDRIRLMKRGHPPPRWVLRNLADLLDCPYDYFDDGSIEVRLSAEPALPAPKKGPTSSGFVPKARRSRAKNNPNLIMLPGNHRR